MKIKIASLLALLLFFTGACSDSGESSSNKTGSDKDIESVTDNDSDTTTEEKEDESENDADNDVPAVCKEGDTRESTTPCGLNNEGFLMETCMNNKWVLGQECSGTDICKNGEKKNEKTGECTYADDCVLSGAAISSWTECVNGKWEDKTESETCDRVTEGASCGENMLCKNAVCVEGPDYCHTEGANRESTTPCGLNNEGFLMETCTGNKWVLGQECSGTDICRNGEKKDEKTGECTYVDQCDQSGIAKTSWTECIIGTWVARTGSETCERVTERLACGSNMICKSSVCEEGPDYCATVGEKRNETSGACKFSDACTNSGTKLDAWEECVANRWEAKWTNTACSRETEGTSCGTGKICTSESCSNDPAYCAVIGEKKDETSGECTYDATCSLQGSKKLAWKECVQNIWIDKEGSEQCSRETDDLACGENRSCYSGTCECLPGRSGDNCEVVDSCTPELLSGMGGRPWDVVVKDSVAYVASAEGGIQIYDISNPAAPSFMGGFPTSGSVEMIVVKGNYAFLTGDASSKIEVFDITNPETPKPAGSLVIASGTVGLERLGDLLFLAKNDKILTINIIDPTTPKFHKIMGIPEGGVRDIEISNNLLYIAYGEGKIRVIDITDPEAFVIKSDFTPGGIAVDISASGTALYAAIESTGLKIFDMADPSTPVEKGSLEFSDIRKINSIGEKLFVTTGQGTSLVDVSDPSNPKINGSIPEIIFSATPSNGYAIAASPNRGLLTVDPAGAEGSVVIGKFEGVGSSNDIQVSGNRLYILDDQKNIRVFDITNLYKPVEIDGINLPQPSGTNYFQIDGTTLYTNDVDKPVVIRNIEDPANITLIGEYTDPIDSVNLNISEGKAYFCDRTVPVGINVVDLSDPASPALLKKHENILCNAAAKKESLLLAAGAKDLQIFNDSGTFEMIKSVQISAAGYATDIKLSGDNVFLAFGQSSIVVVNISNPERPYIKGVTTLQNAFISSAIAIDISGNYAHVAQMYGGFRTYDISSCIAK